MAPFWSNGCRPLDPCLDLHFAPRWRRVSIDPFRFPAAARLARYNVVDTIIIALSLASLGPLNLPISVMRIIRAFRVVRCVRRSDRARRVGSGARFGGRSRGR
jgi:hypothetical protein